MKLRSPRLFLPLFLAASLAVPCLVNAQSLRPPSNPQCYAAGKCTLDDIVEMGANVANFFMEISGALFFLTFIYGGGMYLFSFGDKGRVEKGKKAMTGAAIGIVIVMGAWTIVRTIGQSITGQTTSATPAAKTPAAATPK